MYMSAVIRFTFWVGWLGHHAFHEAFAMWIQVVVFPYITPNNVNYYSGRNQPDRRM